MISILPSIDVDVPREIEAAEGVDPARTFVKLMDNRLRPRFNRMMEEVKAGGKYKAIAEDYDVERKTEAGVVSFALVNHHPASEFLLQEGGTAPHLIVQEGHLIPLEALIAWGATVGISPEQAVGLRFALAHRDITIDHPGTEEDTAALRIIDRHMTEIDVAADIAMIDWADRFGALEV